MSKEKKYIDSIPDHLKPKIQYRNGYPGKYDDIHYAIMLCMVIFIGLLGIAVCILDAYGKLTW